MQKQLPSGLSTGTLLKTLMLSSDSVGTWYESPRPALVISPEGDMQDAIRLTSRTGSPFAQDTHSPVGHDDELSPANWPRVSCLSETPSPMDLVFQVSMVFER